MPCFESVPLARPSVVQGGQSETQRLDSFRVGGPDPILCPVPGSPVALSGLLTSTLAQRQQGQPLSGSGVETSRPVETRRPRYFQRPPAPRRSGRPDPWPRAFVPIS